MYHVPKKSEWIEEDATVRQSGGRGHRPRKDGRSSSSRGERSPRLLRTDQGPGGERINLHSPPVGGLPPLRHEYLSYRIHVRTMRRRGRSQQRFRSLRSVRHPRQRSAASWRNCRGQRRADPGLGKKREQLAALPFYFRKVWRIGEHEMGNTKLFIFTQRARNVLG